MNKLIKVFIFAPVLFASNAYAWGDENWVESQSINVDVQPETDHLQQRINTRQQRLEAEQDQRDRIHRNMRENDKRIEKRTRQNKY